jgi:o-succinylbenzoate synthase
VALAAALPELEYACGLGTVELLARDVAAPSLVPRGGMVRVGRPTVREELLEAAAAPPNRLIWWRERVVACHAVLSGAPGTTAPPP